MDKDSTSSSKRPWIASLSDNDVPLGRGAIVLKAEGHIRFRKLIQENKDDYNATGRHAIKNEIAARVLNVITSRGGRFVRKLETTAEKERIGAPSGSDVYVVVEEDIVLQKIKQALRENLTYKSEREHSPGQRKRKTSSILDKSHASLPDDRDSIVSLENSELAAARLSEQDSEFRLKHPTLRKRDISRLRRQQDYSEPSTGRSNVSGQRGLQSQQEMRAHSQFAPEGLARSERKHEAEDDSSSDEESKPRAQRK